MKNAARWMFAAVIGLTMIPDVRSDDKHAAKPSTSPAFEALKKLVGDWVQEENAGKADAPIASSYKLTASGSALHETMFPGTDHEMINVYHMDGENLVFTHFCALGNQPRLKYQKGSDPKVLEFKSISVSNAKSLNDMHMGQVKFTLKDDTHLRAEWQGLVDQKPDSAHGVKFDLVRKGK